MTEPRQGTFSVIARKWRSLRSHPRLALALVLPAWMLLGISGLLIRAVPLKYLHRTYGCDLGISAVVPLLSPAQHRRARAVGAAIGIASRNSPWPASCYSKALCARALLAVLGVPHVVCFGMRRHEGAVEAHAWVAAGPCAVAGGRGFDHFTVVRAFLSFAPK